MADHGVNELGLIERRLMIVEDLDASAEAVDRVVGGVGFNIDIDLVEHSSNFPNATDGSNHWTSLLLVTFSIITITINLLLLFLFTKRRSLRTVSNRFVTNLLFISFLSSLLLVPFVLLDIELPTVFINRYQPNYNQTLNLSAIPPFLAQFTLNFICTASILSILLIGIDQYIAVLHPLRAHSYMDKAKSLLMIIMTYVVSLASAFLVAFTNCNRDFFPNTIVNGSHDANAHYPSMDIWTLAYGIFYLVTIITTPFITIVVIYVMIYRAAHINSERLRSKQYHFVAPKFKPRPLPKVQSAPSFITTQILDQDNLISMPRGVCSDLTRITKMERTYSDRIPNIITTLKSKISNASAFRYREENRTAKISIMVIVMVLICYAPYGVTNLLNALGKANDERMNLAFSRVSVMLLISANLWSPILFALRNKRVQRELTKFSCGKLSRGEYAVNRRHSRPQIVIQDIETSLNKEKGECAVQVEPFLAPTEEGLQENGDSKSILKRVCSKNWGNYKKCSFMNVPNGCLDARGSFSSASTQISTEE